jgi:dTDP-4-amino-4,6-dideoxygalactose transaminase
MHHKLSRQEFETNSLDSLKKSGKQLRVGMPSLGDRETFLQQVEEILDSGHFTNGGRFVQEFEKRVAEILEVKHCVAVCNATMALEITARALGLKGEVIVPAFTYIATANCLQWQEITPVFCDVDPETQNMDPAQVERLITPRTTGILGVHLWGRACDVEALQQIATKRNLQLFFDASHAFGCTHNGKMIGGFGRAEVFSFNAAKFIHCFEGGVVATNDDVLANRIRKMLNFGFTKFDHTEYLGVNGKMIEISAAMGLTNLAKMEYFEAVNRRNFELYREHLKGIDGIEFLSYAENERNNLQYMVLMVDEVRLGISRDTLLNGLHAQNIIARSYFNPGCHRMEPYRSQSKYASIHLPVTDSLSEKVICLPTGDPISPTDVAYICSTIRFIVANKHTFMDSKVNQVKKSFAKVA